MHLRSQKATSFQNVFLMHARLFTLERLTFRVGELKQYVRLNIKIELELVSHERNNIHRSYSIAFF